MRRSVFLMITVAALVWSSSADVSNACPRCHGRSAGCAECGEVSGGCTSCDDCGNAGCPRHHDCCLNPVKAVKAVLRFLGGSCGCNGCDQEIYWGPYATECSPCDRCGNHRGGTPVSSYRSSGYVPQSSYVPQGEVIHSAPSGGCNCNKGAVTQNVAPRPTSSYTTAARPSGTRYEATATRSHSSQGSYASRSSSDPYAPRLISVTDEVVRPATPTTRTVSAPLNLQR